MVLQQEQRLLDDLVQVDGSHLTALGTRELEQALHDTPAALYFGVDDLEVLRHLPPLGGRQRLGPQAQGLRAGEDGGERVVDLVHHARRQLPDRGELLRLGEPPLRPAPLGDVLADRDDVGDVVGVLPHRDLGDAIVPWPPGCLGLDFDLLDLARVEHPVELAFQQLARLAVQHLEHFAPHRVLARHALRARLPLAVPGADVVRAVDHVQPDGQGVDDAGREVALRLDLASAQRHLRGQVLRQLHARDHGGEDLRRDDNDVVRHVLVTPLGDDHFQGTERFFFVTERQIEDRSARGRLTMRSAPQPRGRRRSVARQLRLVARRGDGGVAAAVGAAHPQAAAAQAQPASQHAHHGAEGLVGGKADRQHLGHLGEDLEARMIGVERRGGHRPLT